MEAILRELRSFMDESGRLTALPAKYKKKLMAYYYLAAKLEPGRTYTESEINDALNNWTAFHDPATLRRELYNKHLLNRTDDGRSYWAEEPIPTPEEFLAKYV